MIYFARLVLFVALASALGAATPPIEKLLPADTVGFLAAPNWEAVGAAFHQSALGQLWAEPAMRPVREKFLARFRSEFVGPLDKELGLNVTNYCRLFQGPVIFASTPAASGGESGFLFVADTGTNSSQLATNLADLRRKWTDKGKQSKTVKIRDLDFATLVFDPAEVNRIFDRVLPNPDVAKSAPAAAGEKKTAPKEWTFGQSGPLFLLSDSPKDLEKLLVIQSGGALPALADESSFAADAPQFRDAQVFAWLNVKSVMDRLNKFAATNGPAAAEDEAPAISPAAALNALGFGNVRSLALTVNQSGSGTALALRARLPESGRRGLFKVFTLDLKDSSPPPFVPADAVKFSRFRADLPKTWANIETTMAELSPPAASFLKFLFSMVGKDRDPNFDLRESFIAKLTDDLVSYEKFTRANPPKGAESPPTLLLVGARNADQAVIALKALTSLVPPQIIKYREREFLGRTIYTVNWPSGQGAGGEPTTTTLHAAGSGSYVALSSDVSLVEEFLRSSDGTARALRDKPGLAEAAQKAGGMNTGFFSTDNHAESARALFEAARKDSFNAASLLNRSVIASRLGMGREGGVLSWFDFSALPPFERVAKYFHFDVSALSANADGFTYKYFAPAPPQAGK
ncbi:MAG: hypothetical protein HZA90_03505 [Verrucomicrobia bacterium]|nr:hypothetical protein [Verrucomicrobiota bacterium]